MRRQKKIIVIIAALAAVLALVLGITIPLTRAGDDGEDTTTIVTTAIDGEVIESGRLLMYEHILRDSIASISCSNSYGEYTFVKRSDGDTTYFSLEGAAPVVSIDDTMMSKLITVTGYTMLSHYYDEETGDARYVVTTEPSEFGRFGLAKEDEDSLPWYKIVKTDGSEYKVYIGDAIPSDGGYYVRLEGRDAVYIRSTSEVSNISVGYDSTVLAPVSDFVTPYLTVNGGYSLSYIYLKNFTITRRGENGEQEIFLMIDYLDNDERDVLNASEVYAFIEPQSMTYYTPDSNAYMYIGELFQEWIGVKTVEVGLLDDKDELDMTKLSKYGLDDPENYILFQMPWMEKDVEISTVEDYRTFTLLISEKQADGSYYVASLLCDTIVKVNGEDLDFLEWEKFDWIDSYAIPYNIKNVDRIQLSCDNKEYDFAISHSGDDISVVEMVSGEAISDIPNFRKFYSVLVAMDYEGDATLAPSELEALTADDSNTVASLAVTLTDGRVMKYRFFAYTSQRSLVSLSGSNEFYTLTAVVKKMVRAAEQLMSGITIDYADRYE